MLSFSEGVHEFILIFHFFKEIKSRFVFIPVGRNKSDPSLWAAKYKTLNAEFFDIIRHIFNDIKQNLKIILCYNQFRQLFDPIRNL